MNPILEAAISHQHEGRSVIAVKRDKRPYHEGWNQYFTHHQTEEEVQQEFANGAEGIALILYPSCRYAVLDFDGEHADSAWELSGISLPETAKIKTRSGGKHLYFLMPDDAPEFKRKVRIVKSACTCKKGCGVDLLIKGYALIPPSPGYSEDPDHPLESAVELPQPVLDRAITLESDPAARKTGEGPENKVSHGERKSVLISLAGSMRARGMSIEAVRSALETDNAERFDPPLHQREIEDVIKSAQKWGVPGSVEHRTDLGNAQRFDTIHHGNVLYSAIRKKWILWQENSWQWDLTGQVLDYAKATAKSIHAESAMTDDPKTRKKLSEHAYASESRSRIDSFLKLAGQLPGIRTILERFDRYPFLFNATNCTIDLKTGLGREFSKNDYLTKISLTHYNPIARCPKFLSFLDQITLGNTDLIAFIQRAAGYSLTGDIGEQAMFLCYGDGSNGKSTLINVLRGILGPDYAQEIKTDVLMQTRSDNQQDYHLAKLPGVRFLAASEPGQRKVLKVDLIKQATGGEPLPCRNPYETPFQFFPQFKLWLSTNHKPIIPDTGDAIWRRIFPIPFLTKFPDDNTRIQSYWDILLEEKSGILNWMIEGELSRAKIGLNPPAIVKSERKEYRAQEDILQTYIDDRCAVDPENYVAFDLLYPDYAEWSKKNNEFCLTSTAFGLALKEKGFPLDRMFIDKKQIRVRLGIRLKFHNE